MPIDNRDMHATTTDTQRVKHNMNTIEFLFVIIVKCVTHKRINFFINLKVIKPTYIHTQFIHYYDSILIYSST